VRALPWPSGRWRARRRIDTGHAGQLHSRQRARAHVQPRCRGGGRVGRGKGCRRRHHSGGGPPESRDAHGRGRHSAAQRTSARRTGRSTRRTGGRVGPTARDGAPLSAPLDGVRALSTTQVLLSHVTLFAVGVIATLLLTRLRISEDTNADSHL